MTQPLYFDCRYIRVDHHDGISRYSAELFAAVAKRTSVIAIICDARQLSLLPAGTKHVYLNDPTSAREPLAALALNRLGARLVYSPMQTIGSLGRRFKLVLTIHDLIYYSHPAPPPNLPPLVRLGWRLFHLTYWPERWLLAGCDAVVAVSSTTSDEIARHRLTSKPVAVVYNAAGGRVTGKGGSDGPTVLDNSASRSLVYMGSFMAYKNVETLVRALALLPEHTLHLLSKIAPARRARLEKLAGAAAARIVFHNGVTDAEYGNLLEKAQALVSASKAEGFGIPLVESMAKGIPVAASNIAIFHEVGGEAAKYFDADSPEALADAINQLSDSATWRAASEAGLAQTQKFSWDASASALLKLVEGLA